MIEAIAIVPTYRRPQETARCLESLLGSEFLGTEFLLETIVVDSSPDDLTWDAIKQFQSELRLRYIKLAKQTMPGEARNLAVEAAGNELIVSIDSDMEVLPSTVWRMITYLRDHPQVARLTGLSVFSSGGRQGQIDCPGKLDRIHEAYGTAFSEGVYGRFEAFYRSAFLELGGYDPLFIPWGEGTELSVRFWRAGLPLGFVKESVAYHNVAAPFGLTRDNPEPAAARHRTLFLLACKYDLDHAAQSHHFGEICRDWIANYGVTAIQSVIWAAKSAAWFAENSGRLSEATGLIPQQFDFKPFDVFTERELLAECLNQAQERISPFHQRAFARGLRSDDAARPAPVPSGKPTAPVTVAEV